MNIRARTHKDSVGSRKSSVVGGLVDSNQSVKGRGMEIQVGEKLKLPMTEIPVAEAVVFEKVVH